MGEDDLRTRAREKGISTNYLTYLANEVGLSFPQSSKTSLNLQNWGGQLLANYKVLASRRPCVDVCKVSRTKGGL